MGGVKKKSPYPPFGPKNRLEQVREKVRDRCQSVNSGETLSETHKFTHPILAYF